jgi:hypothetical protein
VTSVQRRYKCNRKMPTCKQQCNGRRWWKPWTACSKQISSIRLHQARRLCSRCSDSKAQAAQNSARVIDHARAPIWHTPACNMSATTTLLNVGILVSLESFTLQGWHVRLTARIRLHCMSNQVTPPRQRHTDATRETRERVPLHSLSVIKVPQQKAQICAQSCRHKYVWSTSALEAAFAASKHHKHP